MLSRCFFRLGESSVLLACFSKVRLFVIAALPAVEGVSHFDLCLAPRHADYLRDLLSSLSANPNKVGVRMLKNFIRGFTNMDDDNDEETLAATAKTDTEYGLFCAANVAVSALWQSATIALASIGALENIENLNVSVWAAYLDQEVSRRVRRHGILDRTIDTAASIGTPSSTSTHSN